MFSSISINKQDSNEKFSFSIFDTTTCIPESNLLCSTELQMLKHGATFYTCAFHLWPLCRIRASKGYSVRKHWDENSKIGKMMVTTTMI